MKKFITLVLCSLCIVNLAGCDRDIEKIPDAPFSANSDDDDVSDASKVGPGRPIAAYISDDVTKIDVAHYLSGNSTKWTVENDEVDAVRKWASGLKYEIYEYEDGNSPGDGDGGEVYDFTLTEGDYPGFCYVINGPDECYLLIEGYWYSVSNPSAPPITEPNEAILTVERVKELSRNGENLSWTDFSQYKHEDVGFGLYIYRYDIDENLFLLIGGGDTNELPMYVKLVSKSDTNNFIDVRFESVDDFINNLNY